jgi:hypothetical protein
MGADSVLFPVRGPMKYGDRPRESASLAAGAYTRPGRLTTSLLHTLFPRVHSGAPSPSSASALPPTAATSSLATATSVIASRAATPTAEVALLPLLLLLGNVDNLVGYSQVFDLHPQSALILIADVNNGDARCFLLRRPQAGERICRLPGDGQRSAGRGGCCCCCCIAEAYRTGLDDLLQGQVHPRVALHQVAVEGLAILQLNQHGVALRRVQQAERQLGREGLAVRHQDGIGCGGDAHHLAQLHLRCGKGTWGMM